MKSHLGAWVRASVPAPEPTGRQGQRHPPHRQPVRTASREHDQRGGHRVPGPDQGVGTPSAAPCAFVVVFVVAAAVPFPAGPQGHEARAPPGPSHGLAQHRRRLQREGARAGAAMPRSHARRCCRSRDEARFQRQRVGPRLRALSPTRGRCEQRWRCRYLGRAVHGLPRDNPRAIVRASCGSR